MIIIMIMNESIVSRDSWQTRYYVEEILKKTGQLFYVHDVRDTSYENVEEVPDFYRNLWPSFLFFLALENLVLYCQKKPTIRLNDGITSLSHGIIQECGRIIFRGSESAAYVFIYNNWRLLELPWDSPSTWYFALLTVDFCYYWVHRASHEIHIFWAQHQVHHSSEEFNVAVGVRQSLLQGWCSFIFYLPLALFVPPAHFVAHQQFNLIYQVWIHTKTVKSLGPLEYIFNTPQHHRVHHGCNIYCLDKNYGGVFIIWDRLFKTFAEEKEKEEIVYGLVFNQPSFNPFFLQVFYNRHVIDKIKSMNGIKNKICAIVKGPSWEPGSPWTGFESRKLKVTSRKAFDIRLPFFTNFYVSIHFIIIFMEFQHLAHIYLSRGSIIVLIYVAYIILSLTTIGFILENHPKADLVEIGRCLLYFPYTYWLKEENSSFLQTFFTASILCWFFKFLLLLLSKKKIL